MGQKPSSARAPKTQTPNQPRPKKHWRSILPSYLNSKQHHENNYHRDLHPPPSLLVRLGKRVLQRRRDRRRSPFGEGEGDHRRRSGCPRAEGHRWLAQGLLGEGESTTSSPPYSLD